ncbi:MAG TPA: TlpA disulfide reductase family protein [Bryobacteraceae bacterium]|nr:TlpA disulfide reductase family protein [Bryobacteraceae bacterium]
MLSAGSQVPQAAKDILPPGPILLALYKVSCPVCQMTLPFLERISRGSLPVVAISQDDEKTTERFRQAYNLTLPSLLDKAKEGYPLGNAFGITHVPSLFLVEADGVISMAGSGFRKSEIEELGKRSGIAVFRPDENVPEWKAG